MKIPPLPWRRIVPGLVAIAGLTAVLHWSPGRQVRLHQRHFLAAVENRDWKKTGPFIASNYRDQWGQDRPLVLRRLPEIFGDFVVLGVLSENPSVSWADGNGIVTSHIRVVGRGGPIAQAIIARSAELTQPFAMEWRRQSWRPWDWQLVAVKQPELEPPAHFDAGAEFEEWRPTR